MNRNNSERKRSLLRILIFVLIAVATISITAIITLAKTSDTATGVELYSSQPADNEKFNVSNMLPGDKLTQSYNVRIHHNKDINLYFRADITDENRALGDVLQVSIFDSTTMKELFNGTFNELNGLEIPQNIVKGSDNVTDEKYEICVWLDTSVGNAYENALLKADFTWFVKAESVTPVDPTEEEENGLTPKTGDLINNILWALFVGSIALLVILLILNRKAIKEKHTVKRLSRSVFSIILLIAMFAVTTYALLTSSVDIKENLFQTGEVSINLNDGKPIFPENEDTMALNIEPGHTLQREFFIKNTGTADVYYRLYLIPVEGNNQSMMDILEFTLIDKETNQQVFSGKGTQLLKATPYVEDDVLKIGETDEYLVRVKMPESAGNDYQNLQILFQMAADATQAKNNEGRQFD